MNPFLQNNFDAIASNRCIFCLVHKFSHFLIHEDALNRIHHDVLDQLSQHRDFSNFCQFSNLGTHHEVLDQLPL